MSDRAPPPPPLVQHVIALQNTSMCAYNTLIRAYSWRGPAHAAGALALYAAMLRDGRSPPNKYTFPFVLKACSALLDLRAGRAIHRHAARAGLHADLFVSTAFIDLYKKCARFRPANAVFHAMPARDAVAWNVMVAGYALHGMYGHALECLLHMHHMQEGRACLRPNASTLVALLPLLAQQSALRPCACLQRPCLSPRQGQGARRHRTAGHARKVRELAVCFEGLRGHGH
ncbi:pentatricopeptide repeat-containing protein [Hordeum vulgare]|nr:pentatricopeptide repeat-containing protein [Hordeum vulgare]